jgi:hypothetical protein
VGECFEALGAGVTRAACAERRLGRRELVHRESEPNNLAHSLNAQNTDKQTNAPRSGSPLKNLVPSTLRLLSFLFPSAAKRLRRGLRGVYEFGRIPCRWHGSRRWRRDKTAAPVALYDDDELEKNKSEKIK